MNTPLEKPDASALLSALKFATEKHRSQLRKDGTTPYINHPIAVAEVLTRVAAITDLKTLQAALLHDTLEDTETTREELSNLFGPAVCAMVEELTDDKTLAKSERKALQIKKTPALSPAAKAIKIADMLCNAGDLTVEQPPDWTRERKLEYFDWAEQVVAACGEINEELRQEFVRVLAKKRQSFVGNAE